MALKGDARNSYWFRVWNGIFDHAEKIGSSIWVFLWCIDAITREESGVGFVKGGSVVTAQRIANVLHQSERQIRHHLHHLAANRYITLRRAANGFVITVLKSKKRSEANFRSPEALSTENSRSDRKKASDRSTENFRCNKEDITVDITETEQNQNALYTRAFQTDKTCSSCGDTGKVVGKWCTCPAADRLFLSLNPDPGRVMH